VADFVANSRDKDPHLLCVTMKQDQALLLSLKVSLWYSKFPECEEKRFLFSTLYFVIKKINCMFYTQIALGIKEATLFLHFFRKIEQGAGTVRRTVKILQVHTYTGCG
jgi:hypothetical protein